MKIVAETILILRKNYFVSGRVKTFWIEQTNSPLVLPTSGKEFQPIQLKSSAAGEKIRPHKVSFLRGCFTSTSASN
jgi:hypothetical protein